MSPDESPGVARFSRGTEGIGGGVLMSGGRVLTCAHVINAALSVQADAKEHPQCALALDFPLLGVECVSAEVVGWRPLIDLGKGDLAILQLIDHASLDLSPMDLIRTTPAGDEELKIFGFPAGRSTGVWKLGLRRAGPMVGGWQQVIGKGSRQYKLQGGFSGCPVLNQAGQVVGLFAQSEEARDIDTGAYIPIAVAMEGLGGEGGVAPLPIAGPAKAQGARRKVFRSFRAGAGHRHQLPDIWKVPPLRSVDFIGRERDLRSLAKALSRERVVVVSGRPGVGKTQLAVQYTHRHARDFSVVWWVAADRPSTIERDLAGLAAALALSEAGWADQPTAARAAGDWLARHDRWLVVFDNATDVEAVKPWVSRTAQGQALITSRRSDWDGIASASRLEALDAADSSQLLQRRSVKNDPATADVLAERLEGLPLALEQAAAFVEVNQTSLPDYLKLFDAGAEELDLQDAPPTPEDDAVAATWEVAVSQLKGTPGAAALLNVAAFLAPDEIPRSLFTSPRLPNPLKTLADPLAFNAALAALAQHALVTPTGETFAVHRLVQTVTRGRLEANERRAWATTAIEFLMAALHFDHDDPVTWKPTDRLVPHILECCQHGRRDGAPPTGISFLFSTCGLYLFRRAAFGPAQAAFQQALEVDEEAFGPDSPSVATDVSNLGSILHVRGDFAGAREALERALEIDTAAFGPAHSKVAIRVSNLGELLHDLDDFDGALREFERALQIDEANHGPDHSTVAIRVKNIGEVLLSKADVDGAKRAFERALQIDEAAYSADHPEVGRDLNGLGQALKRLGDLDGADSAFVRALQIDEAAYGPDHPEVARDSNSIGEALRARGHLRGAKEACQRALRIDEASYGPHHGTVARDLNNLGLVLRDSEDLDSARAAFERALRVDEAAYGPDHRNVARDVGNLGLTLRDLGDLLGAKAAFERAMRIDELVYGPDHPETKTIAVVLSALPVDG